jgi:2-keto-4-pentenoate hydratase
MSEAESTTIAVATTAAASAAVAHQKAAAILADHRLRRQRLGPLPEACRPATEDAGYAVQLALRERLSAAGHGVLVGYKIGATSKVMQDYLNIHNPCGGSMLAAGGAALPSGAAPWGLCPPWGGV